jgi:DNA topoisomerase-1
MALFTQPKQHRRRTKPPIAELGAHPDTGAPVRVMDGRYGPYVTDGTLNATIPRGTDPKSVALGEAVELLREREARGPAKKPRKRATKKKSTGATKGTKKRGGSRKSAAGARGGNGGKSRKKPPATTAEVVATMEAPAVEPGSAAPDDGNGRKNAPAARERS